MIDNKKSNIEIISVYIAVFICIIIVFVCGVLFAKFMMG